MRLQGGVLSTVGRKFSRTRFRPPECYSDTDRIAYGEALSILHHLLAPSYSRRAIDNHLRYAGKTGKLTRGIDGKLTFGDIARFSTQHYANATWAKSRMRHSARVEVQGVSAKAEQGTPDVAETDAALINQLRRQLDDAVAHGARLQEQINRDRPDTECGAAVRAGGRKGGNSPKTFYA